MHMCYYMLQTTDHHPMENPNFISTFQVDDLSICDNLIKFWELDDDKLQGHIGKECGPKIDLDIKDSVDSRITPQYFEHPLILPYIQHLSKCVELYTETYYFAKHYASFGIVEKFNIQYYKPGGGFKTWHCERANGVYPESTRHLVFMTYLNTVTDGGGTDFFYQGLTINAEKGKTVIWPVDWTYTHKGEISPTQEKYVATGWLNFVTQDYENGDNT